MNNILNVKPKTIQLLQENIAEKNFDLELDIDFLQHQCVIHKLTN